MPDQPEPRPFGLMLRRPGDIANPDATWGENDWALSLPHRCDEWVIDYGTRGEVLAEARRFRDELDQAITALETAGD